MHGMPQWPAGFCWVAANLACISQVRCDALTKAQIQPAGLVWSGQVDTQVQSAADAAAVCLSAWPRNESAQPLTQRGCRHTARLPGCVCLTHIHAARLGHAVQQADRYARMHADLSHAGDGRCCD